MLRSASALSQALTAYNAIQDQYLVEAGVSHPVSFIKGLTITFGPRWEGVLRASIGKALYRDRTKSVPDIILGTHGDAAFADNVWFLNYTYRIPKKGGRSEN